MSLHKPTDEDYRFLSDSNADAMDLESEAENMPVTQEKARILDVISKIKTLLQEAAAMLEIGHSIDTDKREINKLFNSI